jgi:hypothetical protein
LQEKERRTYEELIEELIMERMKIKNHKGAEGARNG